MKDFSPSHVTKSNPFQFRKCKDGRGVWGENKQSNNKTQKDTAATKCKNYYKEKEQASLQVNHKIYK